MDKKAHTFISIVSSAVAAVMLALPSSAQIGIDLGGGSSVGIGGIPGVDASPWPSRSITPGFVGGGNASVIPTNALNGGPGGFAAAPSTMNQTNSTGLATSPQAIKIPTNRSVSLPYAATNLLGPDSVDMSPVPSAQWKYGFPNEATAPYLGVSGNRGVGGFLAPASTASVDLNTYDGPSRVPLTYGQTNSIPNINFSTNIGGVRVGGSVNPVNAFGAVQNFFGP